MDEDEAIKRCNDFINVKLERDKMEIERGSYKLGPIYHNDLRLAIETILDLYQQEKEKNTDFEKYWVNIDDYNKLKRQTKMSAEEHEKAFDKMEKMIDELIGDLQMEGCLKDMTDEEIYRYYEKRVLLTEQNTEGNHIPRID